MCFEWLRSLARGICVVLAIPAIGLAQAMPWDGPARETWLQHTAEKIFVFGDRPVLVDVPELFFGPPPQSFWLAPRRPEAPARDLHVVGVYEGPEPFVTPDGQLTPRPVQVFVRRSARPIVLFLGSNDPVTWEILAEDGVRLDSVHRSGGKAGSPIRGIPDSVPVHESPVRVSYTLDAQSPGESDGAEMLSQVESAVGAPVATFQGVYAGKTFVVPAYQDEAVVRDLLAAHRRLLDERTVGSRQAFHLAQASAIVRRGDPQAPDRVLLTLRGDASDLRAVAYSDVDRKYYGVSSQAFVVIDPTTGQTTRLQPPPGFPEPGWLGGLTYDAKRQRVVFTTLWHTGFHFAFAPATGEWRVFPVDRTEGGLHAVAYDPTQGVLYGLGRGGQLGAFDSDLNLLRTVALAPRPSVPTDRPDSSLQMVMVGDRLVLCSDPEGGVLGRMRAMRRRPPPARGEPQASAAADCVMDPQRGVVCGRPSSGTPSEQRSDVPAPPRCFSIDPATGAVALLRFGTASQAR